MARNCAVSWARAFGPAGAHARRGGGCLRRRDRAWRGRRVVPAGSTLCGGSVARDRGRAGTREISEGEIKEVIEAVRGAGDTSGIGGCCSPEVAKANDRILCLRFWSDVCRLPMSRVVQQVDEELRRRGLGDVRVGVGISIGGYIGPRCVPGDPACGPISQYEAESAIPPPSPGSPATIRHGARPVGFPVDARPLLWQEGSMWASAQPAGPPRSVDEALAALTQIAGRRTLPIPADLIARHALGLPGQWDWPVRRAALEALLRRLASARSQRIAVVRAPRGGPWGRYGLGRSGGEVLPYELELSSVRPLRGACGCPDFLRASLGLCKHLLAVVDHLAKKRVAFARLFAGGAKTGARPAIAWQPAAPLPGLLDPLEALTLSPDHAGREGRGGNRVALTAFARIFRAPDDGQRRLASTFAKDPSARLRLVAKLQDGIGRGRTAADPAARAVLREERARLERILGLRGAAPRLARALGRGKRPLYEYQEEGVRRFLAEGRLVLADDMGLGKTTQAIAAASALFEAGLAQRGLFVVPASLKPQWEREWQAVSDVSLRIVDGGAESRREIYASTRRGLLVTNYEQVVRDLDAIGAWAPELVVLDEAQRIKNWATQDRAHGEAPRADLPAGAHRDADGEPARRAGVHRRVGRRSRARAEVAPRALAQRSCATARARWWARATWMTLRARLAPVLLRRTRGRGARAAPGPAGHRHSRSTSPTNSGTAHDELNQPIAKLAADRRSGAPLTQAEFLRLMSLLAHAARDLQRARAARFRSRCGPRSASARPRPSRHRSRSRRPSSCELRELVASLALTQGRKVVVFSQWRRMLELARWAVSDLLARRRAARPLLHRPERQPAPHAEPRRLPRRSRRRDPVPDRRRAASG